MLDKNISFIISIITQAKKKKKSEKIFGAWKPHRGTLHDSQWATIKTLNNWIKFSIFNEYFLYWLLGRLFEVGIILVLFTYL